jgi:hypothetical protein
MKIISMCAMERNYLPGRGVQTIAQVTGLMGRKKRRKQFCVGDVLQKRETMNGQGKGIEFQIFGAAESGLPAQGEC